ncbi:uncharacterized protein TRAVEDRAFT_131272, partial [Trametes versicolor FP-101664 SS1]|uniref:uncharacterized protein n=1 Tax=Trametes versicolor (strain FP-101664) TaxID=717944 RepID=UPI0004623D2F
NAFPFQCKDFSSINFLSKLLSRFITDDHTLSRGVAVLPAFLFVAETCVRRGS